MSSITECEVREEPLEAAKGSEDSTEREKVGDPDLITEQETYLCDTIEEFRELEAELGVAARWTRPRQARFAPQWESRWKWKPEDGLGWPKHGTDVY